MNKNLILCALIALLCLSCSKKDEPSQQQVTFKVSNFTSTTEPMGAPAPRKAPASLVDGDVTLTDLILFDGDQYLLRQQSTDPNFGTITVMLTVGEHDLHFIATASTDIALNNGILTCASLKPTFGKTVHLNVNGASDENITLDRLTGKLIITINDAIPTGASQLRIQLGDRYTSLDCATLFGVSPAAFDSPVNISGKVGNTGYNVNLYMLAPDADGYETSFTLTATNTSSQVIGQATGTITIAPNTKTLLSGNLFTGTRSFISLNSAWNAEIEENF